MHEGALEFYLALLSVQMVILGFVIAGIVSLIQILHSAKPRRSTRLLIGPGALFSYFGFLSALLLALSLASWSVAFNSSTVATFLNPLVGASMLLLCLAGLIWFGLLVRKARGLLEAEEYLARYIESVPVKQAREYLTRIYSYWTSQEKESKSLDINQPLHHYTQKRQSFTDGGPQLIDTFQPICEYVKDNALKLNDYGTVRGLQFFSQLFDKTFEAVKENPAKDEYFYLAKYMYDNAEEFFTIMHKTASEKRKIDMIRLVADKGQKLLSVTDEGMLTIVRSLENMAKITDDDDEIILCIEEMHDLLSAYLDKHPEAKWSDIASAFEETCLSVTRLAEKYYLEGDNPLRTVPIISHYTGEYRTVTGALVDFFNSYNDLADRYTDAYPVLYFEAIEAVIEALFSRYSEIITAGQDVVGLNTRYRDLAHWLYDIYRKFGLDAIEHNKPELLALCIANLRRIIKPAKNYNLAAERAELTKVILELTITSLPTIGDNIVRGERTVTMYVAEALGKHSSHELIDQAISELQEAGVAELDNTQVKQFLTSLKQ